MRTLSNEWIALITAPEPATALLFHFWIRRDVATSGLTAGRVTPPVGWGSWTYSTGFQGNVTFTDMANYAQDWQLANGGNPITRTYVPAAIGCDLNQVFRKEDTSLDPQSIKLTVDPMLDPFAHYVNRSWPLVFGLTIYRVYRNSDPIGVATVDDGFGHQIPVVDVLFVGYLNADDTLELNAAGLQLEISEGQAGAGAKATLTTEWDSLFKAFDRQVPRPVFSIDCPKQVYSTGLGAAVDCNADMPSQLTTGTVLQMNGIIVSATEWGALPNNWFTQGMIVYTATDPVSGLDFTFTLDINASAQRGSNPTWGDLYLATLPPLLTTGTVCQAYRGCDRTRNTCQTQFFPTGGFRASGGSLTPGTLRVSLQLFATVNPTSNPTTAHVYITKDWLWIVYGKMNQNQIGNIYIGPGTAIAWDPTWVAQGSSIVTSPQFDLDNQSLAGPPAQAGYMLTIANNAANATIQQQPNANNSYTAIIKCPGGSPGIFDFTIAWNANVGTPVAIGNLPNFGGTDIPIEHPSLESTS